MDLFRLVGEGFKALICMNQASESLPQITVAIAREFTELPVSVLIQVDLNLPMYHT
jgi:hypothetical protein